MTLSHLTRCSLACVRLLIASIVITLSATAQFDLEGMLEKLDPENLEAGLSAMTGGGVDDILAQTQDAPGATSGGAGAPAGPPMSSGFILGPDQLLEFHARNLPVADAFAQLRQAVRMNIVVTPEVIAWFTGDLYDMSAEQVVEAICRSTNLVARRDGALLVIEPDRPETRIYELYYARAADALEMVLPLLTPLGQASASLAGFEGIGSDAEDAGGQSLASFDTLVVHDVTSVLDVIDSVIARLDAEPLQVLVEATVLSVELTDELAFGIDFYALQGANFGDGGITSAKGTGIVFGSDGFPSDDLDDGLAAAATGLTAGLPGGGLSVAILRDGLGAFIEAVQTVSNITVLAHPKITTLNKQRGEVLLGRRDGFLTTITTETSTTQTVEFLETGTRLIFRPFITPSGYVRLEVHPEDSDGGINADGLPFKETAEVTTNVIVADGETVIIGGLFREREQSIDMKVPVLGDLPGIGGLFRSENSRFVREEIVIMLTPHIVGPDGEWLAMSPRPASRRVSTTSIDDGRLDRRQDGVLGRATPSLSRWASTHEQVAQAASKTVERRAGLSDRAQHAVARAMSLVKEGRGAAAGAVLDTLSAEERSHPEALAVDQVRSGIAGASSGSSVDARLAHRILDDIP